MNKHIGSSLKSCFDELRITDDVNRMAARKLIVEGLRSCLREWKAIGGAVAEATYQEYKRAADLVDVENKATCDHTEAVVCARCAPERFHGLLRWKPDTLDIDSEILQHDTVPTTPTQTIEELARMATDLQEQSERIIIEMRRRQAHETPDVLRRNGFKEWQIEQLRADRLTTT